MGLFGKPSYAKVISDIESKHDRFVQKNGFTATDDSGMMEGMRKLDLRYPEDLMEIERVNMDTYLLKSSLPEYGILIDRLSNEFESQMGRTDFMVDAFVTEMGNVDFSRTRDSQSIAYTLGFNEEELMIGGKHSLVFAQAVEKFLGIQSKNLDPNILLNYAWEPDYGPKDAIVDTLRNDVSMAVSLSMAYWAMTDDEEDDVFSWPHFEGMIYAMSPTEAFELGNISKKWPNIPSEWIVPDGKGYYPITYKEIQDRAMELITTDEFTESILSGRLRIHHSLADVITLFLPDDEYDLLSISRNERAGKKKTKNIFNLKSVVKWKNM